MLRRFINVPNFVKSFVKWRKLFAINGNGRNFCKIPRITLMHSVTIYCAIGFTWHKGNENNIGMLENDIDTISETKSALGDLDNLPNLDELILCIKKAIVEWRFGELATSERLFHEALKMVEMQFEKQNFTAPQYHHVRAYVLDQMANLNLSCGYWHKAEKLFVSSMQELIASGQSQNCEAFVEMSLKLANLFARQGRLDEAELGFKWCAETQREVLLNLVKDKLITAGASVERGSLEENGRALLGMVESNWGCYLLWHSKPAAALQHLKIALDEAKVIYSQAHPNVLSLRCDIAVALAATGCLEKALSELKDILHIAQENIIPNQSDDEFSTNRERLDELIPVLRVNLGRVLLQTGDLHDARHQCILAQRQASSVMATLLSKPKETSGHDPRQQEWQHILDEANICLNLLRRTDSP